MSSEIVKDIMGCPSQLESSLVDAESVEQLDTILARFERRWNEFEKPCNSSPLFYVWFIKHCRDKIAKYMSRKSVKRLG